MSFLVHTAFATAARRRPDKIAVRYEGREITYAELERDARPLAAALRAAHPLSVVDRVGVFMANRPEYYVAVLAIARAGLTVVPSRPARRCASSPTSSRTAVCACSSPT